MSNDKIFEFLNSINYSKEDVMDDMNEKDYIPYLINHFLSGTLDSVLYAQEMNQNHFLDKRLQYDYLRYSLRKKKRFAKWLKKEKLDRVDDLVQYYGINKQRAREILDLHTEEQFAHIKKRLRTGGLQKR